MEYASKNEAKGFDVLSGVELIVSTIKEERNSEKLLWKICGKVLEIFQCDRAWLLFPCDPKSPSWRVPIERSVREFPGASVKGWSFDMTDDVAEIFQTALDHELPAVYGPGGLPLAENTKNFQVKSQLSMAIFPRYGKPWQFGVHQCSYDRVWKDTEIKLFQIIGIMTAEALGNIISFRNMETVNETLEQRVDERTAELNTEKDFAESLVETAQAIVMLLDPEGRIVRFNEYTEEITGYSVEEVKGKQWIDTFLPENDRKRIREIFQQAITGTQTKGVVNTIISRDGRERIIEWYDKVLKDAGGESVGLLAVGHDVTERVRIEGRIRKSLAEKEVLLQEIHHRVKNNMQVVTSLIGIQTAQMKDRVDPVIMSAFVETQNRINSMALVHERLYRSSDFAHVDFATYIEQLAEDLFYAYEVNSDAVILETRVENIQININQAIPCGLIVNELFSNALKYAFSGGIQGKIIVALNSEEGDMHRLSVCDDGIGLPPEFDVSTATTTGMVIVNALVRQLRAEMLVVKGHGTCFEIRFKGN